MSERTFKMFSAALEKAYHDYLTDYNTFKQTADILLAKAYSHREISNVEYRRLLSKYDAMCEYTSFGALE